MPGTKDLLIRLVRSRCSHSILSLNAHNGLTRHIADLGIGSLFLRVDGRTDPSSRSERQPLARDLLAPHKTVGDQPIVGRAPVEHGFAHLKNWRVLGKVRTDPTWATALVRALLVLTNREVSR
ncbi:hypothetical protein [Streptomyces scopuliridis]|uniref:hypothetical protein n=1 Tax=Streptomyces scopuliridis TaxID=452529 RepID=UPI00342AD3C7